MLLPTGQMVGTGDLARPVRNLNSVTVSKEKDGCVYVTQVFSEFDSTDMLPAFIAMSVPNGRLLR